jgi:hypothetical protein
MYSPGQQQLQSASWLNQFASDRPSFHAQVCRTLLPNRAYQVFVMPQGLLFVESRHKPGIGANRSNAIVIGAVLGGMIGAGIAAAIADNAPEGKIENLDTLHEDELFQLAAQRKRSFVSRKDDVQTINIEVPGSWGRLFNNSTLAGWITVRDRKLGKVTMEVHDQAALSVAVDALPRRFEGRTFVNCQLDRNTARFVPLAR